MTLRYLAQLKEHLQSADSSELENLAAALLAHLLDLPIAVAKSGSQYGADAGPAGQQGRRFRLECKAYSDASTLNERQLLGEIDQALGRDEAIEAWLLVATCRVPEQTLQSLHQHGERFGLPILVIDWIDDDASPLSALCAFDPDMVERKLSKEAADVARRLQNSSAAATKQLRRTLQAWNLGFASIRDRSHERLVEIWNSPRESNAALGQDAAGGAETKRIRRHAAYNALHNWWNESKSIGAPAAVVGREGAGKTWTTLDWLVDSKADQPIVLTIPSTATQATPNESITSIKQLLAESMYDLMGVRDQQHWLRRLDRLLARPPHEGPVLTVLFDGLNQNPSAAWTTRLKILQGQAFSGRCRVIFSTRHHHYTNALSCLRSLSCSPTRIDVAPFDAASGGELDRMLKLHGLTRAQLQPGVLELARTPRLFKLVARLKDNLAHADEVTVHGLLWEYGRDTLGQRGDTSFSSDEWNEWLREMATGYLSGTRAYTHGSLGTTVDRPDLTENHVAARLSDIIDGRFVTRTDSGHLQPSALIVAHALGVALLNHLDDTVSAFDKLADKLTDWLDPISGFDQRAEIMRAALAILIEQKDDPPQPLSSVLITSWLQSQNFPLDHQSELNALAPTLLCPLLDAIEHSDKRGLMAAQHRATRAIRSMSRHDRTALTKIVARATQWLSVVSRDVDSRPDAAPDHERRRRDRFMSRIGRDSSGPLVAAGIDLQLVDHSTSALPAIVPKLLDGFPLAPASSVFETAAASMAIAGTNPAWRGLKWVCLLNEVDPEETTRSLRALSQAVGVRTPEPGVRHDFTARVAALLLWLTGNRQDDIAAHSIDPDFYHALTYERNYLPNPATSFFPLERRHVDLTLTDEHVRLDFRLQRTKHFWFDPELELPSSIVHELHDAEKSTDVTKVNRKPVHTLEDHVFERLTLALARSDKSSLARLIRRKQESLSTCHPDSRYWAAIHATDHILFVDSAQSLSARTLRTSATEARDVEETFASTNLLLLECANPTLGAAKQVETLTDAALDFIASDFAYVMRTPRPDEIQTLITRYRDADLPQQRRLLILLSLKKLLVTEDSWRWIQRFTKDPDADARSAAFKILTDSDPIRFGNTLLEEDWAWSPNETWWINDYGTRALIEATLSLRLSGLTTRIAPWRLLYAARRRGSKPEETRLAATLFGAVLMAVPPGAPVTHADLSVDRTVEEFFPFGFSAEPRPPEDHPENPRLAFDGEAQTRLHQQALDTTLEFLQETRQSGCYFFLVDFKIEDFHPVLQVAPELVDRWIAGSTESTALFQRRVWYAEGAYLGLCEALLAHAPSQGSRLWRTLRATLKIRFVGAGGIDELTHIAFRAPESAKVAEIRTGLLHLDSCNTDRGLYDVAVAACYNDKADWVNGIIETDRASQVPWRLKRADTLAGFSVNNTLPIDGARMEGETTTDDADIQRRSARSKWMEACARHWWDVFVATTDPATAYASWVLFVQSADRRAHVWVARRNLLVDETDDLSRLKTLQYRLNQRILGRALEKRDEKLEKTFLGRSIVPDLGPWKEPAPH